MIHLDEAKSEWQRRKQTLSLTQVPNAPNISGILVTAQKPRPVAVCTRCGAVSYSAHLINGICGRQIGNKRCAGVNGSALNATDWNECTSCAGSGTADGKRCGRCDGSGWLFARDRRR